MPSLSWTRECGPKGCRAIVTLYPPQSAPPPRRSRTWRSTWRDSGDIEHDYALDVNELKRRIRAAKSKEQQDTS